MAVTTLSGTVAAIDTVTSINISSIVFKQGDTAIHTISNYLPSVNSDNTWTLANDITWTLKLTQDDYTVIVNLSEVTVSMAATVPLKLVTAISLALILLSSPISLQAIEVDKVSSTDIVISCSVSLPAISVAIIVAQLLLMLKKILMHQKQYIRQKQMIIQLVTL
jgi:hypothetical protein